MQINDGTSPPRQANSHPNTEQKCDATLAEEIPAHCTCNTNLYQWLNLHYSSDSNLNVSVIPLITIIPCLALHFVTHL